MAQQFNAIIAVQSVIFRGTSVVQILPTTSALPNFRAIAGAAYSVTLSGGQSGSFGVAVRGSIGGTTDTIAGLTTLGSATGNFVLYPVTYTAAGAENLLEVPITVALNRIDQIVPPSSVEFSVAGVANTLGVSTVATVSAVIYSER